MITLGLNIIAGEHDHVLLHRCLKSFKADELFDEVVIVNTSNNKEIKSVAEIWKAIYVEFEWKSEEYPFGNFGGARDAARKASSTDKIMWLDTDDMLIDIHKEQFKKALQLIRDDKNKDILIWKMPYSLVYQSNGEPDMFFMRERVIDREKIHWIRPVHEFTMPHTHLVNHANITGTYITHVPQKPMYASASRNMAILEHELAKDPDDVQNRYFLGRDSLLAGDAEKGVKILDGILNEMTTGTEMLYAIAMELAWYYAYNNSHPRPAIINYISDNKLKVESYCRLAMSFSYQYAEPYVLLGDTYYYNGDINAASRMYLTALRKNVDKGNFKSVPMYGEIPCERLSQMYHHRGLFGMALHYNKQAIRHNKTKDYVFRRKVLIKAVNDEFETLGDAI